MAKRKREQVTALIPVPERVLVTKSEPELAAFVETATRDAIESTARDAGYDTASVDSVTWHADESSLPEKFRSHFPPGMRYVLATGTAERTS